MFYTTKADINREKELLLRQPDSYLSRIDYEGQGVISKVGNDITLTPVISPTFVTNAYQSAVGLNLICQNSAGDCVIGKIKSNSVTAIVFDSTLSRKTKDGVIGAPADWTTGGTVNFYVMTPHATYLWGDYFGVVKEPDISFEEEYASVEDSVDGIIAEGLIRVNLDVTGQNKNITNSDVLTSVLNLTPQGSQSGSYELHGGFRPAARKKFRITFAGKTDDEKDFLLQYFKCKFRAEGSISPNGEDYAQVGWGLKPYRDSLRNEAVNAYMIKIQK